MTIDEGSERETPANKVDPDSIRQNEAESLLGSKVLDVPQPEATGNAKTRCCERLLGWFRSAFFLIYCGRILSALVTRMWYFSLGVLMVSITKDSLLLTAIYGFSSGGAIILFGAVVGDWMDRNNRLKVAWTTMAIRNTAFTISAVIICFMLGFPVVFQTTWNGWLNIICQGLVVLIAVVAFLATEGNVIALERDWIVEISGRDENVLAGMNAIFRRIDLAMAVLTPLAMGQVMTFSSLLFGTITIAVIFLVTAILEGFILYKVYLAVPVLSSKNRKAADTVVKTTKAANSDSREVSSRSPDCNSATPSHRSAINRKCRMICSSFITMYTGWRCYMKQTVRNAGLGLACLYLTVLTFDYLTSGYAFSQGLNESAIGIASAMDAGVGFLGTFGFQIVRSRVGLVRTGVLSLSWQVTCLTLCVASIWTPGSPFIEQPMEITDKNCTTAGLFLNNLTENQSILGNGSQFLSSIAPTGVLGRAELNGTSISNRTCGNSTDVPPKSKIHMSLLVAGMVSSRFGLWAADLTIAQLFLENVNEAERGTVGGVQSSLNMIMNSVRFAVVIVAPRPETFGYLVIMSFCCITIGLILYCSYARIALRRERKRLPAQQGEREEMKNIRSTAC